MTPAEAHPLVQDLQTVLQAAGGTEITFNPLTALTIKKVLLKVAEAEDVLVGSEEITYLSEACCGDLSNAIETLRLFSSGRVDTQLHHTSKNKKVRWLQCDLNVLSREHSHSPHSLPELVQIL